VLEATKDAVLKEKTKREAAELNAEAFLLKKSGQLFFNTSPLDMSKLMGDQDHIKENLYAYIQAFSPAVRDIFECFDFYTQIDRLAKAELLYLMTEKFANIDLHPEVVSNAQMGTVFEELIRKFAELSNETAGEHMSPREVIRLMVNLLFIEDDEILSQPGVVRSLYDPTVATGGMLSVAEEHLSELNPDARLVMFGQELNASGFWQKMRKSLGSKRRELSEDHIAEITRLFGDCKEVSIDPETGKRVSVSRKALAAGSSAHASKTPAAIASPLTNAVPISRIFKNEDFGYHTITVERPLRDESGKVVLATKGKLKGKPQPDANLRDTENVPLSEDIQTYFKREVLPHAPDAWIDYEKTKVGYEIPFNRHFYVFKPPRDLAAIDTDLKVVTDRILTMIGGLSK